MAAAAEQMCDSRVLVWGEAITLEPAGKACQLGWRQIGFLVTQFGVG